MGTVNTSAGSKGQRTSTNQGAGKKHRTPTSSPHGGSRVEPSHETQHRREVLETVPFEKNSNDFVFDSQFLAQAVSFGFKLGDIPVPVRYFPEASSINFRRSCRYGLLTLKVMFDYWMHWLGLWKNPLFVRKQPALPRTMLPIEAATTTDGPACATLVSTPTEPAAAEVPSEVDVAATAS